MTTIDQFQATGPVPTTRGTGPGIPPRMRRRPLTFAALTRRASRRATYARHVSQAELPRLAFVSTICTALTLQFAVCGVVVLMVTR